ncbi:discoidin domain-containing protein [Mucilaginibacter sabulilitoris]|uniref:Discoidin domain-containing protein n=1 Tax=Mucilaginibacter sabulilitoris TaxID=1173583 RepID=A0ABZ0TPG1_9SPHI|nr:discoidin domain-containing protein [Mucilaginibacter sabulilitoris]WPU94342.1 discoidin domain-containing protein [Mucilaginibacter sabulilitoris]
MKKIIVFVAGWLTIINAYAQKGESQWVYRGKDGKLTYKTTPAGDKIMDFSHAGYSGGGVALPVVPVKRVVKPSGGNDDTPLIQKAIDEVAAMPLQNGFRGAVELAPGTFTCSGPVILSASGIVLHGSGSGPDGTTIKMAGDNHTAIVIGRGNTKVPLGKTERSDSGEVNAAHTLITDTYVPSGAVSFTVADASGLALGDTIAIIRPVTENWVHFMEMDNMWRDGKKQTWLKVGARGVTKRKVTAITGNKLTIDIPLADSYDSKFLTQPGVTVMKLKSAPRVTNVGVEFLHIQCPPLEIDYGHAPYAGIRVGGDDCWVKDVYCEETMNTTVLAGNRITMEKVIVKHTYANLGASKPTDFSLEGSENLIDRCEITGGNMYFVWTSSLIPGPNVLLNCTFRGIGSRIQPHQRWSTGLLVDNCTVPDGGIDFMNRGIAGSGHGWTMGWAVAWNCVAKTYIIQNPPGAVNWAIGCIGKREQTGRLFDKNPVLPDGNFDSHGAPVAIQSLYLAQLAERLGNKSLRNIGYAANTAGMFPNKQVKAFSVKTDRDKVLGLNLALNRPVNTSSSARNFGGEKALDGIADTYWRTNDNVTKATFEVDMEGPVNINTAQLSEALGQHIDEYKIEAQLDSEWKLLWHGTTIGKNLIVKFPATTAWKVKLTILKARNYVTINHFGLYLQSENQEKKI